MKISRKVTLVVLLIGILIVGVVLMSVANGTKTFSDVLDEYLQDEYLQDGNNEGIAELIVRRSTPNDPRTSKVVIDEDKYVDIFRFLDSIEIDSKDDMYNIDATHLSSLIEIKWNANTPMYIEFFNDYETIVINTQTKTNSYRVLYPEKVKEEWQNIVN